jgi:hypothetical protein
MLTPNSPACLDNYIVSFNGCYAGGLPTPTSGYYLENLEGLTLDNVAAVSSEVLMSATKTIEEKVRFAADIVEKRLKAVLNSRGIILNKIGNKYGVCSVTASTDIPAPLNRGIRVSKKWLNSPQSRIYVDAVKFKSAVTAATTIYITDLLGNVLWSKATQAIADTELTVFVNKSFATDYILITWDTTAVVPYLYSCDSQSNCTPCNSKYLAVTGWNGLAAGGSGYLGACVRLDCVDTDIICQFLDRLGMAVLYQTGVQILKEWISPNNRLNLIKTHGGEWANVKITEWENASIEALDNEIENIIQILETDKFCYNCRPRLRMYPMLPG